VLVSHLCTSALSLGPGGPRDRHRAKPPRYAVLLSFCSGTANLQRSLIDSPWQDRRPHRLGLTRPAPPLHGRKDTVLDGDAGGTLPPREAQLQVSHPHGHRGVLSRERNLYTLFPDVSLRSRMYACCSLPWTCSNTGMTCMSLQTVCRAATRKRSRWRSSGCAKLVHKSRLARACCSSCKVCTLCSIVNMGNVKCFA
jgi:hypothetical protein